MRFFGPKRCGNSGQNDVIFWVKTEVKNFKQFLNVTITTICYQDSRMQKFLKSIRTAVQIAKKIRRFSQNADVKSSKILSNLEEFLKILQPFNPA